jgi:hypothetical protein
MPRRAITFACTLILAMAFSVGTAHAWGNGGDQRNGFGTHDWILDEAIRVSGASGDWVDVQTALLASDDPDSMGTDKTLHVFYQSGLYGGAPAEVSKLYYEAVLAYRAGDTEQASLCLGRLSHYYSDVLQPFHSNYLVMGKPVSVLHKNYELGVDPYVLRGRNEDRLPPYASKPATDVRKMTIAAASFSRAYYPALRSSFSRSGTIDVGSRSVLSLTYTVLGRAVNDLADIIASVPTGSGLADPVTSIKMKMSQRTIAIGGKIGAFATCKDANGRPIKGAEVVFTFVRSAGPVVMVRFTDSHGVAHAWRKVKRGDRGRVYVTAVAAINGVSTAATGSYKARR